MEKSIKTPRRITEEEFILHLENLAPNAMAKDFILSFYERLKAFDDKKGKHLTYQSFGVQPVPECCICDLCDQAKMLFFTEEVQKELQTEWESYKTQAQKLLKEDATKEQCLNVAKLYIDKQEEILKNSLEPIGFADLFRFQFVNFVDEIKFCETDYGKCNFNAHVLEVCQFVDEKTKEENPEFFWTQNIVAWHELVHLMETKSYHNGANKFLTPLHVEGKSGFYLIDGRITNHRVLEDGQVVYNDVAVKAFKQGDWILNEAMTESLTLRLWQDACAFILQENNTWYKQSPILGNMFCDYEKEFTWIPTYLKFTPIIELVDCFYDKSYHILSCPDFPSTWPVWNQLERLFKRAILSEKVFAKVHENLEEIGVTDKNTKNLLQKFLIILGRAELEYEKAERKDKDPYNPHFILAQTMLLDASLNAFKEESKSNPNASMQNMEFVSTLLKRQKVLHYWLVLPNKNIGTEENPVWAKKELCPSELFSMYPDNLLLEIWADATEKMYEAVNRSCPEKIEESFLMQKTQTYLKKQNK